MKNDFGIPIYKCQQHGFVFNAMMLCKSTAVLRFKCKKYYNNIVIMKTFLKGFCHNYLQTKNTKLH